MIIKIEKPMYKLVSWFGWVLFGLVYSFPRFYCGSLVANLRARVVFFIFYVPYSRRQHNYCRTSHI